MFSAVSICYRAGRQSREREGFMPTSCVTDTRDLTGHIPRRILTATRTGAKVHGGYEGGARTTCGADRAGHIEVDPFNATPADLCGSCFGNPAKALKVHRDRAGKVDDDRDLVPAHAPDMNYLDDLDTVAVELQRAHSALVTIVGSGAADHDSSVGSASSRLADTVGAMLERVNAARDEVDERPASLLRGAR